MPTISEQYNEVVLSLQSSRNTIRNKLVELGIATSSDTIDKLADAIEGIIDRGAVSIKVKEGETASIPAGWHNGAGTVAGIGGGGSYNLQAKTATPTKKQQSIAPDTGYYGLSSVTVNPIPDAYQDVSAVNAAGEDVLIGKIIVTADGKVNSKTIVIEPVGSLIPEIEREIKAQIALWRFESGKSDGQATFNYSINVE